jgi:hypothetical protein
LKYSRELSCERFGICLRKHSVVTIYRVEFEFVEVAGFNHSSAVLDESGVNGEVDTEFHGSFVVEMRFET